MIAPRGAVRAHDDWFQLLQPAPGAPAIQLFCFPHAGGGVSAYRAWSALLPASVELWSARLPGRESRFSEPARTDVGALVEACAADLAGRLRPPYVLFGHSAGAIIAFEVARQLRRMKQRSPAALFVSGRGAPHLPVRRAPIHDLPDPEFLSELRAFGGTQAALLANAELMTILLPPLRADLHAAETYRYQPDEAPLEGPLHAFAGEGDRDVNASELEGWRVHTRGRFSARVLPGGHFFLQNPESEFFAQLAGDLAHLAASS